MNSWLREIRDVYRLHKEELNAIGELDARYRRLVELNVQEQCIRVMKTATWQKHYLSRKHPTVHGWVFDFSNGLIKDLHLPMDTILDGIREIYHLETSD